MDPATMMLVSKGVGALGDLLAGVGGNTQAKQKARALEAGSRQSLAEAGVAAQLALEEGDLAQGRAAVLAAASGGGITGSAVDVLNQLSRKATFNARSAVYRGEMESNNLLAEAEASRAQGRVELITGLAKVGGTVLGAIGAKRAAAADARRLAPRAAGA